MLSFRPLFLLLAIAVLGTASSLAQAPASGDPNQAQSQPQAQSSDTDKQAQSSDKDKKDQSTTAPASNVLILKAPTMPQQVQFKPELRAVDLSKRPKMSERTRMELIQLMNAEFAHTRKYFPLGDRSLVINPEGQVTPGDAALFQQVQTKGAAAK